MHFKAPLLRVDDSPFMSRTVFDGEFPGIEETSVHFRIVMDREEESLTLMTSKKMIEFLDCVGC